MGKRIQKKKYPNTKTQLKVVDVFNATRALFPDITIDLVLCAVYEKKDITYFYSLKHYHPETYNEVYLKPHKTNLKYLNMPPCPVATPLSWYRDFVNQGGLLMTDGNTLPTLNELWEMNKNWKP